jgi:hypothetical protein
VAAAACLAVAGASVLLAPWALAFDPQAWLVWGRDLPAHGLSTEDGPSFKPLPLVVTTPLAAFGDAAQALWLVVARMGALVALLGAWRLGRALGGPLAAAGAVGVLALAPWWGYNAALGNSEGWLAAAVVWAVAAHLERRTRLALVLLTVAALLRPEVWPFLALAGWRAWRDERATVVTCGLVVLAAWFGPDAVGWDGALSAEDAARATPSPSSAALADVPFLAVLVDAVEGVGVAAAVAAAWAAWRVPAARPVGALALAYVALVAVATLLGYAGNPRYLVPALALLAVLAGVGAARLPRPGFAVAVLVALTAAVQLGDLRTAARDVGQRDDIRRGLDAAIAAAGGEERLRACGPVRTAHITRALVALHAGVRLPGTKDLARAGAGVTLLPPPPSELQDQRPIPARGPAGQRLVTRAGGWSVWASCEVGSPHGSPSR